MALHLQVAGKFVSRNSALGHPGNICSFLLTCRAAVLACKTAENLAKAYKDLPFQAQYVSFQ